MFKFTIKDDIFGGRLTIVVGCSIEEASDFAAKKLSLNLRKPGDYLGLTWASEGEGVVWVDDYRSTNEDIAILGHEIHHFVSHLLDDRGIRHSDDSEEVWAYYQQYFFSRALLKLNKWVESQGQVD